MKRKFIKAILLLLVAGGTSSCIEETFPESSTVTADQVAEMSSGTSGLVNAITGHVSELNASISTSSSLYMVDLGYLGLGIIRDKLCSDLSVYDSSYEYYWYWATNTYLGPSYATSYYSWYFYYDQISLSNRVLGIEYSDNNKEDFGLAHFFRAWAYFDLARLYEYRDTGVASLDNEAAQTGIYGLTVPILTEESTEDDARNTPRAAFYDMYRFILDDLDKAEEYLDGSSRSAKNRPDVSTVYGLKARFWLELASRFNQYPEDLDALHASGVDLGIATAQECYVKAADYAHRAISVSGATPLSESEWYGGSSYKDGFNSVSSNSWMLGSIVVKENLSYTYQNFISYMSAENTFGIGGFVYDSSTGVYSNDYKAQPLIGADLYGKMDDADWRKQTWIAPYDAGKAAGSRTYEYKTLAPEAMFRQMPAYTGLKFRPKEGNMEDYSVGAAADYPLMRVEEMYFIEAEAIAGSQGVAAGVSALESFINTYRYKDGSYVCNASSMNQFIEKLMVQKRIEFWGEGIVAWDYKRLNLQVLKGYTGTNFPEYYRLNSIEGYCAPWFNWAIPISEINVNTAMLPNPDGSSSIEVWTE